MRRDNGAVAVEFALIAPLFLLLIFGMLELGRLAFVQISLNSVSHELARAYSLGPISKTTETGIASATANSAQRVAGVGLGAVPDFQYEYWKCTSAGSCTSVAFTGTQWTPCKAGSFTDDVKVRVTLSFGWATPLIGAAPITLTADGVMLCA